MNQFTLCKLVLATCITAASAVHCHAQSVQASQLLSCGASCTHVIRLMQIYGVNNSFDCAGTHLTAQHSPFGAYAVPDAELGDLEILNIGQVPSVDPACGPSFRITVRNNSCRDVCNFHVTVVATLGRIFPGSPNATVCVDKVCAGAVTEVCVQLPIEALAMGNASGNVIGFQRLIVVIDSLDQLAETNEANNLKALACGEIPVVAVAVVQETTTEVVAQPIGVNNAIAPAPALPPSTVPAPPVPQAPPETQLAPALEQAEAGLQGSAVDQLRSAIRMIDQPTQQTTAAIATQ
jgi:hypothetical protein